MTPDEIRRKLKQDYPWIPDDKIEDAVRPLCGVCESRPARGRGRVGADGAAMPRRAVKSEAAVQREVVVPWSCLASDNKHRSPLQSRADHRIYKLAREMTRFQAKRQLGELAPIEGDVQMAVLVFEPNRRRRDIANLLKCLCDGLKGAAYVDDHQIMALTVERAEYDVDRPRAEVTVRSLADVDRALGLTEMKHG